MATVRCPSCGEDEDLQGERRGDAVVVSCHACGTTFDRDVTPRCRACGSADLEAVAANLLEDSGRGDMTTPTGIVQRWLCWACGAEDATSDGAVAAAPGWRERRADLGLRRHLRTREQP